MADTTAPNLGDFGNSGFLSLNSLPPEILTQARSVGDNFLSPDTRAQIGEAETAIREINEALNTVSDPAVRSELELSKLSVSSAINSARLTGSAASFASINLHRIRADTNEAMADEIHDDLSEGMGEVSGAALSFREQNYERQMTGNRQLVDEFYGNDPAMPQSFRQQQAYNLQDLVERDPIIRADRDYLMTKTPEQRAEIRKEMLDSRELGASLARRHPELKLHIERILHNNGTSITPDAAAFFRKIERDGVTAADVASAEKISTASYDRRTEIATRIEGYHSSYQNQVLGAVDGRLTQAQRDALQDQKIDLAKLKPYSDQIVERRKKFEAEGVPPDQIREKMETYMRTLPAGVQSDLAAFDYQSKTKMAIDLRNTVEMFQSKEMTRERTQELLAMDNDKFVRALQEKGAIGKTESDRRGALLQMETLGTEGRQQLVQVYQNEKLTPAERDKQVADIYRAKFAGEDFTARSLYYQTANEGSLTNKAFVKSMEDVKVAMQTARVQTDAIDLEGERRAQGMSDVDIQNMRKVEDRRSAGSHVLATQAAFLQVQAEAMPDGPVRQELMKTVKLYAADAKLAGERERGEGHYQRAGADAWGTLSEEQKKLFGDQATYISEMRKFDTARIEPTKQQLEQGLLGGTAGERADSRLGAYTAFNEARERIYDKSAADAKARIDRDTGVIAERAASTAEAATKADEAVKGLTTPVADGKDVKEGEPPVAKTAVVSAEKAKEKKEGQSRAS